MMRQTLALLLLCFTCSLACCALVVLLALLCFGSLCCDMLDLIWLVGWFDSLRRYAIHSHGLFVVCHALLDFAAISLFACQLACLLCFDLFGYAGSNSLSLL